jgi:3-oxoacyl-[acyl-carrier protein] reductase
MQITQKKTALVTGGLQGIGYAIAQHLHARGDQVFIFDRLPLSDVAVEKITASGMIYLQVDIGSLASIIAGFTNVYTQLEACGKQSLDILVNNAGVTRDGLGLRLSEEQWDTVLDVNLKGAFFCAQQALKRMIKQNLSYIVNISSIVGSTGNAGQTNYAASKAGLCAMTKSLALEYASRGVRVNAVAPGFIQTAMTAKLSDATVQEALARIPLKVAGAPDDIAALVTFLTSGSADYITGQVLHVNGGMAS